MKSADIEVGKEYAVGRKWEAERGRYFSSDGRRRLRRARVVATRVPLRPNRSYGGTTNKSGVEVEWIDPEHKSRETLIPSREVHQLWSEYEAEEKEYVEARAKRERETAEASEAAEKALTSILDAADMKYAALPTWLRVTLNRAERKQDFARLLDAMYNAGALAEAPWKKDT